MITGGGVLVTVTGPVVEPPLAGTVLIGGGLPVTLLAVPVGVGAGNVPVAAGLLAPLLTVPGEPATTTGLGVKNPPASPGTALIGVVTGGGLAVTELAGLVPEPLERLIPSIVRY